MTSARAIPLTPPFAMLQVRSLLQGEQSLPKEAETQVPVIGRYTEMVARLRDPQFSSKFVKVNSAEPSTSPTKDIGRS